MKFFKKNKWKYNNYKNNLRKFYKRKKWKFNN